MRPITLTLITSSFFLLAPMALAGSLPFGSTCFSSSDCASNNCLFSYCGPVTTPAAGTVTTGGGSNQTVTTGGGSNQTVTSGGGNTGPSSFSGGVALLNPLQGGASLSSFLTSILDFIINIGVVVIVLMVVFVGFKFVVAQGAPEKIREARDMLLWTIIGALILLGAKAIALAIQTTVTAIGG